MDMTMTDLRTVKDTEYAAVLVACKELPQARGNYHRDDYVINLLLTVLDYQNKRPTIEKSITHFRNHHGKSIYSHESLRAFLNAHPDDREAAQKLWGNNHWKRLHQLRDLLEFFAGLPEPVTDNDSLRRWAERSDFEKDFRGKVKGLGFAIYKWLTMRVGVNTIKPDIHIHRFLEKAAGRRLSDREAIAVLETVAREIDRKAYELDWSIWDRGTGEASPIGSTIDLD
jgi:hypothetical protein